MVFETKNMLQTYGNPKNLLKLLLTTTFFITRQKNKQPEWKKSLI